MVTSHAAPARKPAQKRGGTGVRPAASRRQGRATSRRRKQPGVAQALGLRIAHSCAGHRGGGEEKARAHRSGDAEKSSECRKPWRTRPRLQLQRSQVGSHCSAGVRARGNRGTWALGGMQAPLCLPFGARRAGERAVLPQPDPQPGRQQPAAAPTGPVPRCPSRMANGNPPGIASRRLVLSRACPHTRKQQQQGPGKKKVGRRAAREAHRGKKSWMSATGQWRTKRVRCGARNRTERGCRRTKRRRLVCEQRHNKTPTMC
jgi:hypothetical protein